MNNEKTIDSIEWLISKTRSQRDEAQSENLKNFFDISVTAYENVKFLIQWQLLPWEEKQYRRIMKIANLRKNDKDPTFLIKAVHIYENIMITMPHLKIVMHNHPVKDIVIVCEKELNLIDINSSFDGNHVPKEEVESAFKPFLGLEHTHKAFKESYDKVSSLYEIFIDMYN